MLLILFWIHMSTIKLLSLFPLPVTPRVWKVWPKESSTWTSAKTTVSGVAIGRLNSTHSCRWGQLLPRQAALVAVSHSTFPPSWPVLLVTLSYGTNRLTTLRTAEIFVLMHSGIVIGYQLLCDAHTVLEPFWGTASFFYFTHYYLFPLFLCMC